MNGTANHHQEDNRSSEPIGDGDEDEDEDFISLVPIDNGGDDRGDEDEEEETTTGYSNNDTREKTNGKRRNNNNNNKNGLPPWMESYVDHFRVNPMVALHNEIVGFCSLMEPRKEEMKIREDLLQKFTKLAKSTFRNCKVEVFGSQATGLCLPTSDIDIVIQLEEEEETVKKKEPEKKKKKKKNISKQQELEDMENWDKPTGSPLSLLGKALRENWLDDLSYLELIENTRIPLVKFTHAPTKISIDVCFNQKGGPQAAALMNQYMEALSPLRPLTFFLKKFMASRGLNQPYTGGVGSFLLQMMILSFLQHRERDCFNNERPSQYSLGALLVEFFEFYSTDFNFVLTGISVRFDGFFFPKGSTDRKKNFWQTNRPFSIALENPLDPTFDVGSPSFRIDLVKRSFETAFKVLLSHVTQPFIPTKSILASILEPSDEMWERRQQVTPNFAAPPERQLDYYTNNNNTMPPRKRQKRR
uniref:Polymerase nucleotidyl transferase domain-containing protein n=1 Tax=Pseudo-nitzschia australis TaxID=44445 RepID=A0A6V0BPQ8_9STRA|mmetsp:Transcript_4199/g.9064  ORF Transcript_4199/g.9064 Transcript_4199/m.9064 type:complete len:473 (+) Transcript_4199:188-1606(+)